MPGIFSWKNRILGRKTPEPERGKHVTVVSEPLDIDLHNQAPRRSVRFNDTRNKFSQYNASEWQNEYGEVRLLGSVSPNNINGVEKCEQPSSNWRYAESSAIRMAMVPLATSEVMDEEPPLGQHYSTQVSSKASTALRHLRERRDHGSTHETRRSMTLSPIVARPITPVMSSLPSEYGVNSSNRWEVVRKEQINGDFASGGRRLEQMNVVFLQANDEVKRAILPPEVHNLEQVKMAFVRAFPNIPRHYIDQSSVKIYIQEPSKGQLFYELDDPSDIRNKSVLKLRDHSNTGMQSPVRFLEQRDSLDDCENNIIRHRCLPQTRPASAMARTDYRRLSQKPYDGYDSTGSDTSNHTDSRCPTRSGSVTPIIDKESRVRMETMERQLAGLSSLVHSALVSKGMSESSRKDMADLRREIMALHTPDFDRATSEEPSSIPDSLSTNAQHQLDQIRQKLQQASVDMKQLRRTAQVNAQHARNYIREAAEEIVRLISQKISLTVSSTDLLAIGNECHSSNKENETKEQRKHEQRLLRLLDGLTKFENNVETVRSSVLTSNRKLKMSEVELLTEGLTQIGKEAASLKTDFPAIQAGIESRIKADMQKIVKEEKYIREQTATIDQSLRRCKALANIMVTMKKLALVQDTTIHRSKKTASSTIALTPLPPPVPPPPTTPPAPPTPPTPPTNPGLHTANFSSSSNHNHVENYSAPATPLTENYENMENGTPSIPVTRNSHEQIPSVPMLTDQATTAGLDYVLQEVTSNGAPPPPPSRYSVQNVHQKFQKPPSFQSKSRISSTKQHKKHLMVPIPTNEDWIWKSGKNVLLRSSASYGLSSNN
ncbi:hypothetical protein KIN20_018411 [Parelaphostrongylus tenuis]|uniref:Actin interacting protein 3 C-terminal domain-containing protein n=1 Tax=Parelaphostrongylus tenuis TaxID=148309 RepID=A0AAD5QRF3_PARTN|nr:hypothetical protein KIN20_018411 [Parelaphostrongylus tenuis]